MALPDRIDPRPPRRIYRWDLDKTYLQTEFDTFTQLVRTALQKASEKQAVPGAAALIRELRAQGDTRLCIISGSPKQMRTRARGQAQARRRRVRRVGAQGQRAQPAPGPLPGAARAGRLQAAGAAREPDPRSGRGRGGALRRRRRGRRLHLLALRRPHRRPGRRGGARAGARGGAGLPGRPRPHRRRLARRSRRADPVRRIFIHLDRLTPPAYFARYGPRVVPVFNYFQAALVLLADGHLAPAQVARVAVEMVQTAGPQPAHLEQLVPGPGAAGIASAGRGRAAPPGAGGGAPGAGGGAAGVPPAAGHRQGLHPPGRRAREPRRRRPSRGPSTT